METLRNKLNGEEVALIVAIRKTIQGTEIIWLKRQSLNIKILLN